MARLSTEEFLERLQKGKPVPAVLLLGDEPYLRDECRKQLIEKYVPEAARTWAISRFSADNGETQAAVDQAQGEAEQATVGPPTAGQPATAEPRCTQAGAGAGLLAGELTGWRTGNSPSSPAISTAALRRCAPMFRDP
jgi:hypothetical protein